MYLIILSILSYILGSFNFPIIVSKHFGKKKDIRSLGSNNAGFSNVLRSVGILPAFLVFVGDFLKGVLSVYIGNRFINNENISLETNYSVLLMFGFFCFLGHIY
ncbi:MAG: glycerol-3-phosphate acyltransferase, partial [Firmicutes bacterium]|nr:glycerol-3-phosphate acyltransferase [Bacillota bacterium]